MQLPSVQSTIIIIEWWLGEKMNDIMKQPFLNKRLDFFLIYSCYLFFEWVSFKNCNFRKQPETLKSYIDFCDFSNLSNFSICRSLDAKRYLKEKFTFLCFAILKWVKKCEVNNSEVFRECRPSACYHLKSLENSLHSTKVATYFGLVKTNQKKLPHPFIW